MSKTKKKKTIHRKNLKQNFWSRRNIIWATLVVAAVVTAYFLFFKETSNEPKWIKEGEVTFLSKDDKKVLSKIEVEVANNQTERMQGLMYRSEMDEDKGMLFIFDKMEMQSFWMKNTIMSLDILFIDSKGVINTIHRNTTPYSEKSLASKQVSQFVVEVVAGYCQRHGINEGDLIEYKLDQQ
ncbi:MAG: DUF192 domain-containing protein [Ignavibacteria bacterium]|nr:DUF192 domain-containing protein [Ignavibacteria bacterium]